MKRKLKGLETNYIRTILSEVNLICSCVAMTTVKMERIAAALEHEEETPGLGGHHATSGKTLQAEGV